MDTGLIVRAVLGPVLGIWHRRAQIDVVFPANGGSNAGGGARQYLLEMTNVGQTAVRVRARLVVKGVYRGSDILDRRLGPGQHPWQVRLTLEPDLVQMVDSGAHLAAEIEYGPRRLLKVIVDEGAQTMI